MCNVHILKYEINNNITECYLHDHIGQVVKYKKNLLKFRLHEVSIQELIMIELKFIFTPVLMENLVGEFFFIISRNICQSYFILLFTVRHARNNGSFLLRTITSAFSCSTLSIFRR